MVETKNSFMHSKKDNKEASNKKDNKIKQQVLFDEKRSGLELGKESKKPFDKKTYRLKKYSKKYKLLQWQEQRREKLYNQYQKDLKDEAVHGSYKPKAFDEDITDSHAGRFVKHPDLIEKEDKEKSTSEIRKTNTKHEIKKDHFLKAKENLKKAKQEELEKKMELKKEKERKLKEYKKKKLEVNKKLSRKNKRGQPIMSGRLELLLEKIQKQ